MDYRYDTFTGGEHYWIRFYNGQHEVRKANGQSYDVVFTGHFEDCLRYLEDLMRINYEYDHNL
jgi:hypothetical protein